MNLQRLWSIIRKEFTQFFRDRRSVTSAMLMPLLQLVIYGYLSSDVKYQHTIVWDQSHSVESRALLQAFVNSHYFTLTEDARTLHDVERSIDLGHTRVGIVIPPDYAERIREQKSAPVMVVVDASDATAARTSLSVAQAVGSSVTRKLVVQTLRARGQKEPKIGPDIRARAWYNPDLRSEVFIVPGVLALILQFSMTFLSMNTIVRERELGTLEQLAVSPIKPWELLLGKQIPLIVIGYANVTTILVVALFWFGVPLRGDVVLLYALTLAFFFSTLGIGTLVSTVAKTYLQAVQLIQFALMPSMLLSGFIFPRETMPVVLQWISNIFPLTYFLTIVRGIIIKGVGVEYLWEQIGMLVLLGVVVFGIAVIRFRKKIA